MGAKHPFLPLPGLVEQVLGLAIPSLMRITELGSDVRPPIDRRPGERDGDFRFPWRC
ncbi:MAG: hypothetical protein WBP81_15745 [Solirubrobacteraceae bacterium]